MVDLKDNIADLDLEGVAAILEEERNRKQRKADSSNYKSDDKPYKSRYDKFEKEREKQEKKQSSRYKSRSRSKKRERTRDTKKRSRSKKGSRDRRKHYSRSNSKRRSPNKHNESKEDKIKDQKLIDKQIDEASNLFNYIGRQAIEAQRDDCTVLALRLHLKCKEKDVFNFFAKANIGRIIDIKIIRDQRSGKSKG